jgi:hypothetical protein
MDVLQQILSATKNITQSELEHLEYMQDQINILYESIKINQDILGKRVFK